MSIEVAIKEFNGRYATVPNGPFPIAEETFLEVVNELKEMMKDTTPLDSGWASAANVLLKSKGLKSFDSLSLAVAAAMIAQGNRYRITCASKS